MTPSLAHRSAKPSLLPCSVRCPARCFNPSNSLVLFLHRSAKPSPQLCSVRCPACTSWVRWQQKSYLMFSLHCFPHILHRSAKPSLQPCGMSLFHDDVMNDDGLTCSVSLCLTLMYTQERQAITAALQHELSCMYMLGALAAEREGNDVLTPLTHVVLFLHRSARLSPLPCSVRCPACTSWVRWQQRGRVAW